MSAPAGRLQVCATPIGNLGDITLRVLDALRDADVIQAEDTRVTRKLLSRYEVRTPLEAYHARNADAKTTEVVARISSGATIALVSDAGTPGISDPGAMLVDACLAAGIQVEVFPGPSAIVAALVASGLPTHAFYFGGFLPRKAGALRRRLEELAGLDATLIFYESPKRVAATLAVMAESLQGRQAAVVRELTKLHEEVARDAIEDLAATFSDRQVKGEVVLLIGPGKRRTPAQRAHTSADEAAIDVAVRTLVSAGSSKRDAVRKVSEETGVPRSTVYEIANRGGSAREGRS